MRNFYFFVLGVLAVGGLIGCSGLGGVDTDPNAVFQANMKDIQTYVASKGFSGTTTSSGLFFALTRASSSTVSPAYGEVLEYNYRLYVLYGASNTGISSLTAVSDKLVDSTYLNTSAFFPFFQGSLQAGLEEGLLKMHEGDQATMIMPAALAFGSDGSNDGKVPPNSAIRYDVRLIRARTEDQQINDYIAKNNLTVTKTTADGLRLIMTKSNPTGATPVSGQTVVMNYTGSVLSATTVFVTGTGDLKTIGVLSPNKYTAGLEEGISLLKVGEKATIIFPSSLGYGNKTVLDATSSSVLVYPNSVLRYDIELVSIQ